MHNVGSEVIVGGYAKRIDPYTEKGCGPTLRNMCLDRIPVVFADEQHRQLVQSSEIQAFVENALFGAAIAEEGRDDPAFALSVQSEGVSHGNRYCGTDHRRRAEDVLIHADDVHGAAL